jgi:dTMP kinase
MNIQPDPTRNARFLTLEGVEGSGKTTQIRLLTRWLEEQSIPFILTREPGGTPFGQQVRQVLLDAQGPPRQPLAELLLYLADRHQDLQERILPALAAGRLVLCDRYHDATLAYQGYARGIPLETISRFAEALQIRSPDLTFLLDIDPAVSLTRAIQRNQATSDASREGRFEAEDLAFHRRVRNGYLDLARRSPERFRIIPADRAPEPIFDDILRHVQQSMDPSARRRIERDPSP